MTDKILTEAFDKLKAIEESDDPFCLDEDSDDVRDGIYELRSIQQKFLELHEDLQSAIRAYAPDQLQQWETYGLAHLSIIFGSDAYASNDESISTLIERLESQLASEDEVDEGQPSFIERF